MMCRLAGKVAVQVKLSGWSFEAKRVESWRLFGPPLAGPTTFPFLLSHVPLSSELVSSLIFVLRGFDPLRICQRIKTGCTLCMRPETHLAS
jgi:hypothetical protein